MAKVNLSEAARLTKKNRSTIWRHVKSGKLSVTKDHEKNPVVDVRELIRVYGDVATPKKTSATPKMQKDATPHLQHPDDRVEKLLSAVEKLEGLVENQAKQIQQLTNLLEHKPEVTQKKSADTDLQLAEKLNDLEISFRQLRDEQQLHNKQSETVEAHHHQENKAQSIEPPATPSSNYLDDIPVFGKS